MEVYDVVLCLLPLACAYEISLDVAKEPGWFALNFKDSILYDLMTFDDPGRSAVTHPVASVDSQDEWHNNEMGVALAPAASD